MYKEMFRGKSLEMTIALNKRAALKWICILCVAVCIFEGNKKVGKFLGRGSWISVRKRKKIYNRGIHDYYVKKQIKTLSHF